MYTNYKLNRDRRQLVAAFNDAAATSPTSIPQLTSRRVRIDTENETTALVEIKVPVSKRLKLSFQGSLNTSQNHVKAVEKLALELFSTVEQAFERTSAILALYEETRLELLAAQQAMAKEWHGYSVPVIAVEPSTIAVGSPPTDSMDVVMRDWDDFLEPDEHVVRAPDADEAARLYTEHTERRLLVGMRAESVRSAGATGLIAESAQIQIDRSDLVAEEVYDRLLGCDEEGLDLDTGAGSLRLYYQDGLVLCDARISDGVVLEGMNLHFDDRPDWLDDAAENSRIGDFLELPGINPDAIIASIISTGDGATLQLEDEEMYFWAGAAAARAQQLQATARIAA